MPDDPVITYFGTAARELLLALEEGRITFAEYASMAEGMITALAQAIARQRGDA